MRLHVRFTGFLVILAMILFFSGCDRINHDHNNQSAGGEEIGDDTHGTVDDKGGTIEPSDDDDQLKGVKVVVPEGAVGSGDQVTISIGLGDGLPGAIDGNIGIAGLVYILRTGSPYQFRLPIQVTVPYSDDDFEDGDIPAVFCWDEESGKYISVGIKEIDPVNRTVTFTTIHTGTFVVLTIKGLDDAMEDPDGSGLRPSGGLTGFLPHEDGFFHPNFGSYDSPGGSSMGMAAFSSWYYQMKLPEDGGGLYGKYLQGYTDRWEDDSTARELISRAFMGSRTVWSALWPQTGYKLSDDITGKLLVLTMKVTGAPQILILSSDSFGHAVTVYDYALETDPDTGKERYRFFIYDGNFPGEVVTLDWDPVSGFSSYSKADAYPDINKIGFEAFSSLYTCPELEAFYQGAENGWDASKFQTISIVSPELDENGTATVDGPDNVLIEGTVSGGLKKAGYLVYSVNGTDGLSGEIITLGADGSFSFTIPNLPRVTNSIMLMTTDDLEDAKKRIPNAYAGFREITIKVRHQTFFRNLGFETGDFTSWTHKTSHGLFFPICCDKNGIETAGTDPIAPFLPKVYAGSYSARVNSTECLFQRSTVSQTAVVPDTANPELKFYWAAVLDYSDIPCLCSKPYVSIVVTDDTTGTDLYNKRFSAGDPSYSGWKTVTRDPFDIWKVIPWQVVIIDLSEVKGHEITMRVVAADCHSGLHSGYVYLDGKE